MSESHLLQLLVEGLYLLLLISLPPLLAALAAGAVTGLLQAATRVWDPSIALAPRVGAVLLSLVLAGPWVGAELINFTRQLWLALAQVR